MWADVTVLSEKANVELVKRLKNFPSIVDPYACLQCGKCTSGCTVMVLMENFPHRVVDMVRLGLVPELLKSDVIWACTQCQKCRDACPQKVNPSEIFIVLRNLSIIEGGSVPDAYSNMLSKVLESGFIQDAIGVVGSDGLTYDRLKLSLPQLSGPKNVDVFQANCMDAFQRGV
ncbi:MAG: 4Fe-4S dicluster domain-containing protein [archaeon YNP-LCB-003-016]|uniref:4Fe-4S dicluster domain-containing protein n=1 Tax=Candidatus Culexarchaeum yellowstonense TaxID=2928963 RepID=UPI0026ED48B8|nr:4Fe-4S dicluster domain-containing protein [Candidatus Culexarchaeum yellowstonense]MCC6018258.1 4Fe-4S dicluster domain-containing protein [Candidatus Verstraetearchaeota archaeon]MCR6691069.1 4Fe-4S dicluster domain-containing protein [Candidatus Culexarchaeum yellowstonense]